MLCSIDTKRVDFVFLKVKAKRIPPVNVNSITKAFLKKICANENKAALIKINKLSLLNKD